MKRFLIVFFLLISITASAQYRTPTSVQTDQNWGYLDLATHSVTIAADETLNMKEILPYYAKGFKFNLFGGDVLVCSPDNISTGSLYLGDLVASGTTYPGWTGLAKPSNADWNILICPRGAEVKLRFTAW